MFACLRFDKSICCNNKWLLNQTTLKTLKTCAGMLTFVFKRKTIIYLSIISLEFQLQLSYGIIIIKYSSTHQFCACYFKIKRQHSVKGVRIRSYSGPYFPVFGVNTERYSVSLLIQSECGKTQTRITPITHTFYAVLMICG